ncbi:hypothetical protein QBC38DRAFT_462173 [Podospora fimiseda]|uniref:Uncharacterized protein n=1 Tax=Podospora fimiseda TaxID=252190 RepID=A0AAN6YLA3_9PEZI|nr:hypothetical protein QBC38DRAFT_462173 [Podospora fimiseda]
MSLSIPTSAKCSTDSTEWLDDDGRTFRSMPYQPVIKKRLRTFKAWLGKSIPVAQLKDRMFQLKELLTEVPEGCRLRPIQPAVTIAEEVSRCQPLLTELLMLGGTQSQIGLFQVDQYKRAPEAGELANNWFRTIFNKLRATSSALPPLGSAVRSSVPRKTLVDGALNRRNILFLLDRWSSFALSMAGNQRILLVICTQSLSNSLGSLSAGSYLPLTAAVVVSRAIRTLCLNPELRDRCRDFLTRRIWRSPSPIRSPMRYAPSARNRDDIQKAQPWNFNNLGNQIDLSSVEPNSHQESSNAKMPSIWAVPPRE